MKRFILTEEEKFDILSQYNLLVENVEKNPVELLNKIKSDIENLLSYYEKREDGKFYDISVNQSVNLNPVAGFFKAQIESVLFGAKNEKRNEKILSELESIKNQINQGPFTKFFGDYELIQIPKQKFDFYTEQKCSEMNPKSPGCKV